MTEIAVEQSFTAELVEVGSPARGAGLSMMICFSQEEPYVWDAVGIARAGHGSVLLLECPVEGSLVVSPGREGLPSEYTLQLTSHFPDGRLGFGLDVTLSALSFAPPVLDRALVFTGRYTLLRSFRVAVPEATFEMTSLRARR